MDDGRTRHPVHFQDLEQPHTKDVVDMQVALALRFGRKGGQGRVDSITPALDAENQGMHKADIAC